MQKSRIRSLVLLVGVSLCLTDPVRAQGSAFTYQGQLKDGGVPANGSYDLTFALFPAASGGSQVGSTIIRNGVVLTNGLLTQTLDFGAGAFSGERRWIEITANGVLLTPRQEITAVPYALSVPGLDATESGLEVSGDIHTPGEVTASAFSSNSPLIFKVNPGSVECARFDDANCFLGLGVTNPQARLHIGGTPGVDGIRFPDGSLQTTAAGLGGGGGGFWTPSGTNIFNNNGGNVGIGTNIPGARLEVVTDTAAAGDNSARFRAPTIGPNASHVHYGTTGDWYIRSAAGTGKVVLQDNAGTVGIGTQSPQTKLHLSDPFNSVSHRIETGAGTNGWSRVEFVNGNGQWNIGTSRTFNNDVFYMDRPGGLLEFQLSTWGGLGLGTEPQAKLHLFDPLNSVSHRIQTGAGTNGWTRVEFVNGDGQWNIGTSRNFNQNEFYFHREGSPNLPLRIRTNGDAILQGALSSNALNVATHASIGGTVTCKVLAVTGADVAEKFPSSEEHVEPGTVMEIDPDQAGKLRMAREPYSTRVAGVVSGAGGLPAGAVLGNFPGSENAPAIALSGRVWVQCDAGGAAISPGDLLTSSTTPGHAMRAIDRDRSHGAILGKAMTALESGQRGLVLVLVNLQ